jgi:hypothetical protein
MMTADELRDLTTAWFTDDPQDTPEIAIAGARGRYGAVFEFFALYGGTIRAGSSLWDPIAERDVPLESMANPGEAADAGRAQSFVAEFQGLGFNGIKLPSVSVWPQPPDGLQILWDCGPQWETPAVVAAFFDLLASFEEVVGVRLDFETQRFESVGPRLGEIYALWVARFGGDEEQEMVEQIRGFREMVDLPVTDEIVDQLVQVGFAGTAVPGVWERPEESARRERREAEIEAAERRLQDHLAQHSAAYAGSWLDWHAGVPALVVAFVGDLATHEAAIAGPGVRVVSAKHPRAELLRIADELTRQDPPAPGVELYDIGVNQSDNVVDLVAYGTGEARFRALLADRYGDAVRLTWEIGGGIAG